MTGPYIIELLRDSFVGHSKLSKDKNLDIFITCELSLFRGYRHYYKIGERRELFTFQSSESFGLTKFSASLGILTKLTLMTLYGRQIFPFLTDNLFHLFIRAREAQQRRRLVSLRNAGLAHALLPRWR